MVSRWIERIYQLNNEFGFHVANQWAKQMFNNEQMVLINREIERRKNQNGPKKPE